MRDAGSVTPVLILTALDAIEDRVRGLDGGADDYLVKPFALQELVARLRALLRRPGAVLGRVLTLANVSLDSSARLARVGRLHPRHSWQLNLRNNHVSRTHHDASGRDLPVSLRRISKAVYSFTVESFSGSFSWQWQLAIAVPGGSATATRDRVSTR